MAKRNLFFLLLVFHSVILVLSQLDEFLFRGFKGHNSATLTLNGAAEIKGSGFIRLTNDTSRLLGRAFYSNPIRFRNSAIGFSFSTAFAFAVVTAPGRPGGHGMTFVISPTKEPAGALPNQYFGLVNQNNNGNFSNHLFAIEFDTVQDLELKDINDNHVGIDINGLVSNDSVTAGYFVQGNSTMKPIDLKGGYVIQAWIDYDSVRNEINVSLSRTSSKPSTPILSAKVDLSPILEDYMYVGFSASTGLLASSHYILGWSFKMNGQAPSLDLSSLPKLPQPKKSRTALIAAVSAASTAVLIFSVGAATYLVKKIRDMDVIESWELDVGPHRFSYKQLKQATKGFRDKELIGFGGFGRVYKGVLRNWNSQLVAVKRISRDSRQGLREFASEITSIGRLRHRNLVQLLGWCRRRNDLLLVYDFMPNGSLDKYIFDEPEQSLNWEQRFRIIKGVASGLLYLHDEWEQVVIHRDVKAGNVLLDSEMNGRLGDFGLAKLYEHGTNPSTTRVVGTLGYLAPELTRTGKPTTASDVFAFGALLLEVVCGRRPIEPKALPEELILVEWVWQNWVDGTILKVVDSRLGGHFDEGEVIVVIKLGLICSNDAAEARPSMRQVVRYLDGEIDLPETVAEPEGGGGGGGGLYGGESVGFSELHSYSSSKFMGKTSLNSSEYETFPLSRSGGTDGRLPEKEREKLFMEYNKPK